MTRAQNSFHGGGIDMRGPHSVFFLLLAVGCPDELARGGLLEEPRRA